MAHVALCGHRLIVREPRILPALEADAGLLPERYIFHEAPARPGRILGRHCQRPIAGRHFLAHDDFRFADTDWTVLAVGPLDLVAAATQDRVGVRVPFEGPAGSDFWRISVAAAQHRRHTARFGLRAVAGENFSVGHVWAAHLLSLRGDYYGSC